MKVVAWRGRNISESQFLYLLALVVGVLCGLAAQLLKYLIHVISGLLKSHLLNDRANLTYLIYPVIGILLVTLFVRYVVKDNISHGVTRVLYAISQRKSRLKKKNCWASLIASSVTIGFGGSVGAEGPI
ncbi:MAG: chloride channel protein, partial [Muribaculaceae bacterium]|nr:chloride channel protein [Muribaculaceae bacterium]